MAHLLEIRDLHVSVEDKEILHGINLVVDEGEVHVVMGPNGAGKSTLAQVIMGNPTYEITQGQIIFEGEDITELDTDKRAKLGIFLSFQNPFEIPGVTMQDFLRQAKMQITGEDINSLSFYADLVDLLKELEIDPDYALRYLNVGFSGGEKKKSEMLQMIALDPKFALLDEPDSGLDVDAVKVVSQGARRFIDKSGKSMLIITHHRDILASVHADKVHILKDGRSAMDGDAHLIERIENEGFGWIE